MPSRFVMQIVDTYTGDVVEYAPGLKIETEFITDCVTRITAKGVGFAKTTAQVSKNIEDGITEAIFELKKKVVPSTT